MSSGVTAARGFRAAGAAAGLKSEGALDVAVVVNDGPEFSAAAVVTENQVKAAPVIWTQQVVRDGSLRAVVLNSGGANACTGVDGDADTAATARHTADAMGVDASDVAVCSTGLIGVRLAMPALLAGVTKAVSRLAVSGGIDAALSIMTTDTRHKVAERTVSGITIGGMAKGAGMLAPSLATMLCVITTDAEVAPATLDAALREATRLTFDRVDSDGCLSTNDTVIALASGASGVMVGRDLDEIEFGEALTTVCQSLADQLLSDAEGASKQIEVRVEGAATESDALVLARSIARSNLFKCAVHGEDANWGRVLAAVGATPVAIDPKQIDVQINGVVVCRGGSALAQEPAVDLTGERVTVAVALAQGTAQASVWTNDLTAAYVHENSAYST
jgi:glutamate N-acetyltransferase/amino-acid N-acetyltransferase